MKKIIAANLLSLLFCGCYEAKRDCEVFRDGTFSYTALIDGQESSTTFTREGELEVDYFEGRADSSEVRWINDCEYILKKISPASRAEEMSIHVKILSTTDTSYTFEYGQVGKAAKTRGTAIKTN